MSRFHSSLTLLVLTVFSRKVGRDGDALIELAKYQLGKEGGRCIRERRSALVSIPFAS